ncbi:MAG: hypothetical protein KA715_05825 [Xanthomonadaceae bacterium]|nr:hypothetical protein [Xanthomonadaceae bacterium]
MIAGICLGVSVTSVIKAICIHFGTNSTPIQFLVFLIIGIPLGTWFYRIYPAKAPIDELELRVEFETGLKMRTGLYLFLFLIGLILEVLIRHYPEAQTVLKLERTLFFSGVLVLQVYEQLIKKREMGKFLSPPPAKANE